ncbi:glycosyltransferase [uncultured Methylobacterium sp.]|uniref:glycosyltransferase n=1 Tax=uncultured Methylobacterium sp. TaxID=157278 RepID=UPI0035CBAA0D
MRLQRKRRRERRVITESGLFDTAWYLDLYPDVAGYPGGSLEHFLDHGAAEGRPAGPHFDTAAYIAANPDVIVNGANPLVHYIRHGSREGRGFASGPSLEASRRAGEGRGRADVGFSLLLGNGEKAALAATLTSLAAQLHATFEVILAGSDASFDETLDALQAGAGERTGLDIRRIEESHDDALCAAIRLARHDFVILLDPGDIVAVDALIDLADFLHRCAVTGRPCDVVYGDELQSLEHAPESVLKPGWSPELLTAYNYFGRLTAIRREVALAALPDLGRGAAAEWGLNLRVTELTHNIERLPKVLCRRTVSTTLDRNLALSAPADHVATLEAYWKRRGHDAHVIARSDGTFRSTWPLARRPLVSIIIPAKGRADRLRVCTEGLSEGTGYGNVELIVVDHGATEPDRLALHAEMTTRGARIVDGEGVFNRSRACNLGAAAAKGEWLLFLDDGIEVVERNWLDELVRQALEPGIGIVGAKLLDPDGSIRHAGMALGPSFLAEPGSHRAGPNAAGPIGSPDLQRNAMAVSGACQLIPRAVFDLVGGYDEGFLIAYGDVAMSIEAARAGFRSVYLPSAVLVHHEDAARDEPALADDRVLLAGRFRALGVAEDPHGHPALDTGSVAPEFGGRDAIPSPSGPGLGQGPAQETIDRLAGPPSNPLDIYDDGAVASAFGLPWAAVTWRFDPMQMVPGVEAAARILIEFVRRRRDLRARFPEALTEGASGGFARWVKTEGLGLLGLGEDHARAIDAAFEANLGSAARQILIYDEALRREDPLFLLPNGRATACRSLFSALRAGKLGQEDLWWFLVASAEDPMAELCATWAITPSWQAEVPDGGTVFGLTPLALWVARTYGVTQDWIYAQGYPAIIDDAAQIRLAYAARADWREAFPDAMTDASAAASLVRSLATRASGLPFLPRGWAAGQDCEALGRAVARPGVNILGHFSYPSGLRISTESIVEGLRANDVAVSLRDVPVALTTDDAVGHTFNGCEVYGTTMIHVQPEPFFDQAYERSGLLPRTDRTYRIGYWYWEFDDVPSSWNRAALACDEIWTATEFIAGGLRARYKQPVHVFLPGIEIEPFRERPRAELGLPPDAFVFLFMFHMTSIMERKNPLGLIKAFKQAFGREDRARLVIKTSFGEHQPEAYARLEAAAADANVILINRTFSRHETLSLIAACDAYVSLHRSEGLGLSMAEAMLLGRPVVATRYSGNLDFMDDDNSLLVDCRIVTLDRDLEPYRAGQRWAEPSVTHAAAQMRRLYDDPAFARRLGVIARRDLEARLNYQTTGKAIADRLALIEAMP